MTKEQNITAIIKDKRGNVLSIGNNSYVKSHPLQAKYASLVNLPEKIYLHAEIDSIIKCRDISKAYSIEVFRVGKRGTYLNAKPCPICERAISLTKIKKVYFT